MGFYFLKQHTIASTIALSIENNVYIRIKSSREVLSSAIAIEEKYDILVENFAELERELLNESIQHMIFNLDSYDALYETKSILNRRIINLLTAVKLYKDQITKHVRSCTQDEPDIEKYVKDLFSNEYDSNLEFRLIEAFRNHVQHYGLAIHRILIKSSWDDLGENRKQLNQIQLFIRKDELKKDSSFKKSTFNEIPDEANITHALRIYMGCISNIHDQIRVKTQSNIESARSFIVEKIEAYKSCGGDPLGLNAVYILENNPTLKPIERIPLLLDWDEVRRNIQRKNHSIKNIKNWYVSNR